MKDDKLAFMRAHRNNISRYERLLATQLTELERNYVERRLAEERTALMALTAPGLPIGKMSQAKMSQAMTCGEAAMVQT